MEANPYDEVIYESHPYSYTQPHNLYTLGRFFGLKPEPYTQCRVLELGCATGGNLIPLAYNYPKSSFVGIDLSEKQIKEGNSQVNELGLSNIQMLTKSITDLSEADGKFDYIICHGIYSWVDEVVRDKIIQVFHENLAPMGVGFISYNTLPGWNMVKSIRDMMLFQNRDITDPKKKAANARAILQFIGEGLKSNDSPYAKFINQELHLLKNQPDSYLLHDHMEEVNYPLYFHQFASHLEKHNLSYLSDTNLATMFPANFAPDVAEQLSKIPNIVRSNQYIDFLTNNRFRMTLVCHNNVAIDRNLKPQNLMDFHIAYCGQAIKNINSEMMIEGKELVFTGGNVTLKCQSANQKFFMLELVKAHGKPIAYNSIRDKLARYMKAESPAQADKLILGELNLLRLVLGGIITLHSGSGSYSTNVTSMPKASEFARYQSQSKGAVTNQRHESVRLTVVEKLILEMSDGKTEVDSMKSKMLEKLKKGDFTMKDEKQELISDPKIQSDRCDAFCLQALDKLAKCALLIS